MWNPAAIQKLRECRPLPILMQIDAVVCYFNSSASNCQQAPPWLKLHPRNKLSENQIKCFLLVCLQTDREANEHWKKIIYLVDVNSQTIRLKQS